MNTFIITLYSALAESYWQISQVILVLLLLFVIKKFKISGIKTASFGFILLFITMLCNIISLDVVAGKIAEYVWILFAIAFIQQFSFFLKQENK